MSPSTIDLPNAIVRGSEEWRLLGENVRKTLEVYGWMVVRSHALSDEEKEEMFEATESLFALPVDTKMRHTSGTNPYNMYNPPREDVPNYESLGIVDAPVPEKATEFTQLMWPSGNDKFCKILQSTSSKIRGLAETIINIICDSYGVDEIELMHAGFIEANLRIAKYTTPMKEEPVIGLIEHVDAPYVTVLCNNGVEGLYAKSKNGEWLQVMPEKGSFVIFVGQALKAWSNGRLYAPLHKVTIGGDRDRLMFGLFMVPKEDEIIQPHHVFVDDEHPVMFKPFVFKEYFQYYSKNYYAEGTLESFAGI